jgi:flagellar biosynthesis protein FlhA
MAMLTPDVLAGLLRELNTLASAGAADGRSVPLVVPPGLRVGIRRLIEPVMPALPVVSLAELPATVQLTSVGHWEMKHAA